MADRPLDGWERHRRDELRRWASVSPARRLAWLEEARELLRRVRADKKPVSRDDEPVGQTPSVGGKPQPRE